MGTTTVEMDKTPVKGVVVTDLGRSRAWQALGLISVAALVFIYRTTIAWWWGHWWADESYYSHGILIPFMSAFVIWFNWKRVAKTQVQPSVWGLALLIPAVLLQFVAHRGAIPSVSGLTLPIALTGASLLLFGRRLTAEFIFPILFLYFMCVPPTQYLAKVSFKIQMLSTTWATLGLKLIGLDAHQSGTQIQLPNIQVLVGAPCSGFRMLIALVAFTAFFAYMKVGPMLGRLSLVAMVIPLSFIANSVRVLMIALVGEYMGEDAMHAFHDYSGYIVLVIAFAILIQLAKVVKCRDFKSMPA